jgi:hypothetical protein
MHDEHGDRDLPEVIREIGLRKSQRLPLVFRQGHRPILGPRPSARSRTPGRRSMCADDAAAGAYHARPEPTHPKLVPVLVDVKDYLMPAAWLCTSSDRTPFWRIFARSIGSIVMRCVAIVHGQFRKEPRYFSARQLPGPRDSGECGGDGAQGDIHAHNCSRTYRNADRFPYRNSGFCGKSRPDVLSGRGRLSRQGILQLPRQDGEAPQEVVRLPNKHLPGRYAARMAPAGISP